MQAEAVHAKGPHRSTSIPDMADNLQPKAIMPKKHSTQHRGESKDDELALEGVTIRGRIPILIITEDDFSRVGCG